MTTLSFEDVRHRTQFYEHRVVLLRQLVTELETRFGRLAPDGPDHLVLGDRYELPRRDVVDELRGELIRAEGDARRRYRAWSRRQVDVNEGDDVEPMEMFPG
ncbi:MAG: hypothetical protein RIF41_02445 [Polyangiaceae bacterium]